MAYDSDADELVLTGSESASGHIGFLSRWNEPKWTMAMTTPQPAPRSFHALAYSTWLHGFVLCGGGDRVYGFPDCWLYSNSTWSMLTFMPSRRVGHALAAYGSGLLMFGGEDGTGLHFDTYTLFTPYLQPPFWQQTAFTSHPSARAWHRMAATDQGVLLFGGRDSAGHYNDETWLFDRNGTWRQLHPTMSPPARVDHGMVWDSVRHRVVLVGGSNERGVLYDTWEWDGSRWWPCGSTTSLERMPVVYDAGRGRGVGYRAGTTKEWDGYTWTPCATTVAPPAQAGHTLAYDAARGRTVLFGGQASTDYRDTQHVLGETWEWNGLAWERRVLPRGPQARTGAVMAYDAARRVSLLFGGETAAGPLGDTWLYDGRSWQSAAIGPGARAVAAACYDARRRVVVLFGGIDASGALADTWEWDGVRWQRAMPQTSPPARGGHALAFDTQQGVVVMVGGWGPDRLNDMWQWDGIDWQRVRTIGQPPPCGYNLMWDERMRELVVSGASYLREGRDDPWLSVWIFSRTPAGSQSFDAGCGRRALQLCAFGLPAIGNDAFALDVKDAPSHAPLALFVGARPASLPIPGGCRLLVDPTSAAGVFARTANGTGRATFPLPLAPRPAWRGVFGYAQAIALDAGSDIGFATSARLEFRIGD